MQGLSHSLVDELEQCLNESIVKTELLQVGDSKVVRLWVRSRKSYVVKYGSQWPDAYEQEAYSLEVLRSTNTVEVVKVVSVEKSFLLLDFIETCQPTQRCLNETARRLAALHAQSSSAWGWPSDNYLAMAPQRNVDNSATWGEFYAEHRLRPLLELCVTSQRLENTVVERLKKLIAEVPHFLTFSGSEQKSLLHGDLWFGNLLWSNSGGGVLIDPASYFGHREADLAMLSMFGGVPDEFFSYYEDFWPLADGWQERRGILQLYYLLYHVWQFGSPYCRQIEQSLARYGY